MLATNHVLAGALLGSAITSPYLLIPTALASHVVMDLVPHWGKFPNEKYYHRVAKLDGILLLLLLPIILFFAPSEKRFLIFIGAFAALFFDFDKPYEFFFGKYVNHRPLYGKKFLELNIKYQKENFKNFYIEFFAFTTFSIITIFYII